MAVVRLHFFRRYCRKIKFPPSQKNNINGMCVSLSVWRKGMYVPVKRYTSPLLLPQLKKAGVIPSFCLRRLFGRTARVISSFCLRCRFHFETVKFIEFCDTVQLVFPESVRTVLLRSPRARVLAPAVLRRYDSGRGSIQRPPHQRQTPANPWLA